MKIDPNDSLAEIGEQFAAEFPDGEEATAKMKEWMAEHPDTLERCLREGGLHSLCQTIINVARHQRTVSLTSPSPKPRSTWVEPNHSVGNLAARSVAKKLAPAVAEIFTMNVGKKLLGNCNRDDLLSAAFEDKQRGAGHMQRALWFEKLAAGLTKNETVKQKFSASKVLEIRDNAKPVAYQKCGATVGPRDAREAS